MTCNPAWGYGHSLPDVFTGHFLLNIPKHSPGTIPSKKISPLDNSPWKIASRYFWDFLPRTFPWTELHGLLLALA